MCIRDRSGHYVIISTSRLMRECGGNVGAVIAACGHETLKTLAKLEIPYDEIHFGQPCARDGGDGASLGRQRQSQPC